MDSTMSLFDDATMEEFDTQVKAKPSVSEKTSVRVSLLLEQLFFEKNNVNYVARPSLEIPMLKTLSKKITRREMYCLVWTVAHKPPRIRDGDAVLALRYIVYHADRIMATSEYKEMLEHFNEDAMNRIEERIDDYFESKHTE